MDGISKYYFKVNDLLSGFKNVNNETKKNISVEHDKILNDTENKLLHYGRFSTFTNVFNGFSMYLLLDISSFITVAVLLLKNLITLGTASAGLVYIKEFIYPVRFMITCLTNIKSTKSVKKKLIDFLNYEPKKLVEKNTYNNNIEFVNISKKFDSFELNNFCYTFKKGKKYALIGQSGSGKSLIFNLLMKYIEQDDGEIYVDGINIKSFNINQIAVCINQFEHIYKDDFENNVTIYKTYDSKNIEAVLDFYQCDKIDLIKDKKDGTELSGGEKQLLYLVKILLMNKNIILLDESFSAIDIKNTLLVKDKLYSIKDKTFIVVTHNLSNDNLKYFDEVIVINEGVIQKSGKPYEIIKSKEYNDLIKNM